MLRCSKFGCMVCVFPNSNVIGAAAMLSWMSGKSYSNAIVPGPYHFMHPFPERFAPRRSTQAKETLPDGFPEYMVYVTRHSLLALTTSLTDASTDAHSFFVKLNFALSVERMTRSFMQWGMPASAAASAPLDMIQSWFPAAIPAPKQPEYFVAAQAPHRVPPPPAPQHHAETLDAGQGVGAAYAALMAFSAACIKAAAPAAEARRMSAAG